MLEFGCLAERVDERLAVPEAATLQVAPPAADGKDIGQWSVRTGLGALDHRVPLGLGYIHGTLALGAARSRP